MNVATLSFVELANRYCERQESTPEGLLSVLSVQKVKFQPIGWVLLECVDLGSSYLGSLTVLPIGPNNTWKGIPDRPISPRGLASDMSTVAGFMPIDSLPDETPDELKGKFAPIEKPVKKRKK